MGVSTRLERGQMWSSVPGFVICTVFQSTMESWRGAQHCILSSWAGQHRLGVSDMGGGKVSVISVADLIGLDF